MTDFNYGYELEPFMAGQVTDSSDRITDTASMNDGCTFGVVLCFPKDNPLFYELPSATNTNFAGCVQHEHLDPAVGLVRESASGQTFVNSYRGQLAFPPRYPIPLLLRGRIAMQIDDDVMSVSKGQAVYVRTVDDGTLKKKGQLRKDAGSGAVIWQRLIFTGRIIPGKLAEVSVLAP